jgi:polysaccharide export outer membrane protein
MRIMRKYKNPAAFFVLVVFLSACATGAGAKDLPEVNDRGEAADVPSGGAPKALSSGELGGQEKPPSFVLGPGDSLDIAVYRHDDLKRSMKVDLSGKAMFPLIGDLEITGKDVFQLRDEIRDKLSNYVENPEVLITITASSSQKVVVLGEVKNPSVLTMDTAMTLTEAVAKAGGLTPDAKGSEAVLIRRAAGGSQVTKVNVSSAMFDGDIVSKNVAIWPGDIIYVPTSVIADVSWLFSHITNILGPIVTLEGGIVLAPQASSALRGTSGSSTLSIPTR